MYRRSFMNCFVLTALLAAALTSGASAGELVPFRGTLDGHEETLAPPPVATILGVGGGHATQLGRFIYDLDATIDFRVPPPHGVGVLMLTAANGDILVAETDGFSTAVIPGLLILIMEDATIVDGTGRFAGASGSFAITRLKYQDTGDTIGSFDGTISIPVANP